MNNSDSNIKKKKNNLTLTVSEKAQSHMMVARALLSWLPWTMTTTGSEIIYSKWHDFKFMITLLPLRIFSEITFMFGKAKMYLNVTILAILQSACADKLSTKTSKSNRMHKLKRQQNNWSQTCIL